MSISSENASLGSGSLKGRDPRSPSVIAEFNKRRLHGDYGVQPNAPSVGIKMGTGANSSAIKATSSRLGPKLWHPESSVEARRASTLASSSSSSFIPDAHYVEDPTSASLASKAATSAIQVSGEEYGAKHQPEAYNWNKRQTQWSHLGAARSAAAAQREEGERFGGVDSLKRAPPSQSIDISKVLSAAQANAEQRLASANNHLPANFGVQTEEEKNQRRQQVLSLISIADQRVKARMEELNRDVQAPQNVFGSIEFQKIAMEVATRTHGGRLDNHGKLNLGGGLYMTQDEVDDIARRHVQPVLDKVQLVADKKRIADREAAEREALNKKRAAEQKEAENKRKAEEKQRKAEEKQRKRQADALAKQKRERAQARAKEQHPQGSHLWHWQQVEIIKEEVKEAKQSREEKTAEAARLRQEEARAKEELNTIIDRHHELKRDYFGRGDAIEAKQAEYDPDAPETASLFELKQERDTVKENTKLFKTKRTELEQKIASLDKEASEAEAETEKISQHHHDLKKKYFEAREEAEEAEKKFQIEEEARLKREAEERAKREAEEAERKKREAEAAAKQKEERAKAAAAAKAQPKTTNAGTSSAAAGAGAGASAGAAASSSAGPSQPKQGEDDEAYADYTPPPKSKLLSLGDARSGPVLAGYRAPAPAPAGKPEEKSAEKSAEKADEKAAEKADKKADETAVEKTAEKDSEKDASATTEPVEADASKEVESAAAEPEAKAETETPAATETTELPAESTEAAKSETADEVPKPEDEALIPKPAEEVVPATESAIPAATEEKSETPAAAAAAAKEEKSTEAAATESAVTPKVEESKEKSKEDSKEKPKEEAKGKKSPRTYEQVIKDEEARAKATEDKVMHESKKVGGDVAGAVTSNDSKTKLSDEIPLNEPKDQFSGFDSSNVKEKVENSSPGVFKEDL